MAVDLVQPAIHEALARAGYDPATQQIDVVTHSMGGLAVRYLVEHPVGTWAEQVDDLVMVATRHGSHGFDDQVPAESPFLTGAALDTFAHLHGRLLRSDEVVALVVRTLAAR